MFIFSQIMEAYCFMKVKLQNLLYCISCWYSETFFFHQQHLYTSSPFSAYISLDMRPAPTGALPERPNPFEPTSNPDIYITSHQNDMEMLMIVGPVIGAVVLVVILLFLFLFVWK